MNKLMKILSFGCKLNIIKSIYYSILFKGRIFVGKGKILIEGNGRIEFLTPTSSLYIGVYHTLSTATTIVLMNNSRLQVGDHAMIHRGTKVVLHEGSTLRIGDNSYINESARIYCKKKIMIGNDCAIAWNANILDNDLHAICDERGDVMNIDREVNIGNKVWIGANSSILKGTTIDDNCIVAAHSVVTGELHSHYIYGGNPLKPIKSFSSWKS